MLINAGGLVWIGRRLPKWVGDRSSCIWQMPQGGIAPGEDTAQAALRELEEETAVRSVEVLAEASDWLTYELPEHLMGIALKGRYRGQRQKWFAMRFTGDDSEIDIRARHGRKGVTYYRFRNRPIEASWTGFSEQPSFADARAVGETLIQAFTHGADDDDDHAGQDGVHGVDELHIVYTEFKSLMTQTPVTRIIGPMEVEERARSEAAPGLLPAYEFEPEAEALLDALLPKYINTRIYAALLDSAASESAARRRAMKSATDNAEEMIQNYTREMNSARQAGITQEISEIVGGANALAAAGSEV